MLVLGQFIMIPSLIAVSMHFICPPLIYSLSNCYLAWNRQATNNKRMIANDFGNVLTLQLYCNPLNPDVLRCWRWCVCVCGKSFPFSQATSQIFANQDRERGVCVHYGNRTVDTRKIRKMWPKTWAQNECRQQLNIQTFKLIYGCETGWNQQSVSALQHCAFWTLI